MGVLGLPPTWDAIPNGDEAVLELPPTKLGVTASPPPPKGDGDLLMVPNGDDGDADGAPNGVED